MSQQTVLIRLYFDFLNCYLNFHCF